MHQKHYWLFSLKLFQNTYGSVFFIILCSRFRFYDLFYRLDCMILCLDQFVKFKKKNRPSVGAPERRAHPKMHPIFAKILYHLRGSHASGTFVRAGCYFYTYFYIIIIEVIP